MQLRLCAVLACVLLPAAAFADNPITPTRQRAAHPNQSALQRTRIGHNRTVQIGADADWTCLAMPAQGDAATCTTTCTAPQIIPWYSVVQFKASASGGAVCFSQTPNGTDITFTPAQMVVADAQGPDGAASCFYLEPNQPYAEVLDPAHFASSTLSVLRRTGICESAGGVENGRPCRVDLDCGAGTDVCDTTPETLTGPIGGYVCGVAGAWASVEIDIDGTPQ